MKKYQIKKPIHTALLITLLPISIGLLYFLGTQVTPKSNNPSPTNNVLDIHESHMVGGELIDEYTLGDISRVGRESGLLAPWNYEIINLDDNHAEVTITTEDYSAGICTGANYMERIDRTIQITLGVTYEIGTCSVGVGETYYWSFEYHAPYEINSN